MQTVVLGFRTDIFRDRRVVFAAGLVVGCLATGWLSPIVSRVHISLDGPAVEVYEDAAEDAEAFLANEDLGRIDEAELAAFDVVEVENPEIPDGIPSDLKRPAKRAKERLAKPRPAKASTVSASAAPAVLLSASERALDSRRQAYIQQYGAIARASSNSKVPASYLLAYALVKGGSEYALKANNHFDIRCTSRSCPDGHCLRSDQADQHKWFFTRYKSAADSYVAQAKFLSKKSLPTIPAVDRVIQIYHLQNLDK